MRCLSRSSAPKSGVAAASRSHLLLRRLTCEVKADYFPLLRLIFIFFFFCLVVQTGEYKQHKERGGEGEENL